MTVPFPTDGVLSVRVFLRRIDSLSIRPPWSLHDLRGGQHVTADDEGFEIIMENWPSAVPNRLGGESKAGASASGTSVSSDEEWRRCTLYELT